MDQGITHLILQDRQIAYAILDSDLNVHSTSGAKELLPKSLSRTKKMTLWQLAPEMIGHEQDIEDILAGILPRLQLMLVNRELESGDLIYVTLVNLPYRDDSGKICGLVHLIENVTEIGQAKQELMQQRNELHMLRDQLTAQNLELAAANAELQNLDEVKSRFVSVAAHELRSPLASISGYIEILLEEDFDPLTKRQQQYLGIVRKSATRLLNITNNLLDITRIEAGYVELFLQPTNLVDIIEIVADEIQPTLDAKDQQLFLDVAASTPEALCDETRTIQILSNLLNNASKYTHAGGEITVRLSPAQDDGFVQIAVSDNGVGISEEDQMLLFDRFFRAKNAHSTGATGAGLGLNITRSLVELHGGNIWFTSQLNQGTTFFVTLPINDAPQNKVDFTNDLTPTQVAE